MKMEPSFEKTTTFCMWHICLEETVISGKQGHVFFKTADLLQEANCFFCMTLVSVDMVRYKCCKNLKL